ncbi:MAG: WxcM-like domain-containing protein [Candidatus Chisholmbacteria bacterium]|nr:WxcM-like domain-containing protein [Candidatus Chisholmbacteria bacterium]
MRLTQKHVIKPLAKDRRGKIVNILEEKKFAQIANILVIDSKKGTVRANHYHKRDSHYMYLISGKMRYSAKDMRRKNAQLRSVIVNAGEIVYTPPMTAHAVEFLEDSLFLALATKSRRQKAYEKDTVRLKLIGG